MHRETPAQFVGVSDSDIDVMSEIDINLTFDSLVSHQATACRRNDQAMYRNRISGQYKTSTYS